MPARHCVNAASTGGKNAILLPSVIIIMFSIAMLVSYRYCGAEVAGLSLIELFHL